MIADQSNCALLFVLNSFLRYLFDNVLPFKLRLKVNKNPGVLVLKYCNSIRKVCIFKPEGNCKFSLYFFCLIAFSLNFLSYYLQVNPVSSTS